MATCPRNLMSHTLDSDPALKLPVSRRSILRGIGAGALLSAGMWRNASAQSTAQPVKAAFFYHANGAHPDWAPGGIGYELHPDQAPRGADGAEVRGHHLPQADGPAGHEAQPAQGRDAGPVQRRRPHHLRPGAGQAREGHGAHAGALAGAGHRPHRRRRRRRPVAVAGWTTTSCPGIRNPLFAYERLASVISPGNPMMNTPGNMDGALRARRSLLDFLKDDVGTLRTRAGAPERRHIDSYLDAHPRPGGQAGWLLGRDHDHRRLQQGHAPDDGDGLRGPLLGHAEGEQDVHGHHRHGLRLRSPPGSAR